jgi:hypothetical protein
LCYEKEALGKNMKALKPEKVLGKAMYAVAPESLTNIRVWIV